MERRDLIKAQIEQLGRILGQAVADLLNISVTEEKESNVRKVEAEVDAKTGISVSAIIEMSALEFETYLVHKNWATENIEEVIIYFQSLAQKEVDFNQLDRALSILEKAQEMFGYIAKNTDTFSMKRIENEQLNKQLIAQIKKQL